MIPTTHIETSPVMRMNALLLERSQEIEETEVQKQVEWCKKMIVAICPHVSREKQKELLFDLDFLNHELMLLLHRKENKFLTCETELTIELERIKKELEETKVIR
jgi:hypothetical protein